MGRPSAVQLGPFTGGLNLASDPTSVASEDLQLCSNLGLDLDSSLVIRPSIDEYDHTTKFGATTDYFKFIGTGLCAGQDNVFFCIETGATSGVYRQDVVTGVMTLVQASLKSKRAVQYGSAIYVVATADSPVAGVYVDALTNAVVQQPAIPRGEDAIFYKTRMWIVPGPTQSDANLKYRCLFSEVVTAVDLAAAFWPAGNNFDVGRGDGQSLNSIKVTNNSLVLFKNFSTYYFSYDIQPTQGSLNLINNTIGAADVRKVASFENSLIVFSGLKLYEFSNYNFTQFGMKVDFILLATDTVADFNASFISRASNYLFVRFKNVLYVYDLNRNTWSTWETALLAASPLAFIGESFYKVPFAGGIAPASTKPLSTYKINFAEILSRDSLRVWNTGTTNFDAPVYTGIQGRIVTKVYNYEQPSQFKRLAWFGVDLLLYGEIDTTILTTGLVGEVTWTMIENNTWNSLATWDLPVSIYVTIPGVATHANPPQRIFTRFFAGIRFRQVAYSVVIKPNTTLALANTTRDKIFTISTVVGIKELVPKDVN